MVSASLLGTPGLNNRSATIGLIGLALLLGIWFAAAERRAAAPLVDLSAIVRPGVLTANIGTFFASFIMAGGMFLSVLYGQFLAGTSAAAIGVLLAPYAVATLAVAPAAGRLSDSLGPRNLAVAGLAGLAVSVALPVLWHPSSAAALVSSSNLIAGISLGIAAPALLRASVEPVPRKHAGVGAGLYKTVNELCGVFGVVLLGTLLEARVVANALRQIPGRFLPQPLTLRALTPPGALETHALQHGLAPQAAGDFQRTLAAALHRGFDQVFGIAALLAGLGILAAFPVPRRLGASR